MVVPPQSPDSWHCPMTGTFKLNFDGAAKGNPARYGRVIRNTEGNVLNVFWGDLGETTNNIAELEGLVAA